MLPVVAEHRLPKGVTSLCPSTGPGLPVTAGTRNGDIFQLTMTRQVWLLPSASPTTHVNIPVYLAASLTTTTVGFLAHACMWSGTYNPTGVLKPYCLLKK